MRTKFNNLSVNLDIDYNSKLCNRARLDTGTYCNYRCGFCYYKNHLDVIDSLEDIKIRVDYLRKCGINEIDLSGGESSIHPDWFNILEYCNGFHISTLSNGYKFSDKQFMEKSVKYGLKEILFSLHGYNKESHDKLVGFDGAYERIMKAIDNAKNMGLVIRINCTVNNDNYMYLDDKYVKLLEQISPLEVNFIPLNYWDDNKEFNKIDYKLISEHIKNTIDMLDIQYINVRYIPYCFMVSYEDHVCDYYQHIYDIYDWNMALYEYNIEPEVYKENKHKVMYETAKKNRLYLYYKKKECLKCKYFYICDGIEYDMEVEPNEGEKIKNPMYYRMDFYADT